MNPLIRLFIHLACVLALMSLGVMSDAAQAFQPDGKPPISTISINDLPPEARATLALIKKGGPFPYSKDGTVFGNREKLLPIKSRGYYKEYTVRTPGAKNRGARRIVSGGGVHYYTDDHYASFKRIQEGP